MDGHLRQIEQHFNISIVSTDNVFHLSGRPADIRKASELLNQLYHEVSQGISLSPNYIHLSAQSSSPDVSTVKSGCVNMQEEVISTHRKTIKLKGSNQAAYVRAIQAHDITFGIGPAGTGKTHLAVACAVAAFEKAQVARILLVRPAVEAGEKLGFLPGDLTQKIDPYLRPLYDSLFELMNSDKVNRLIERRLIEVVPLAYMRGRTLSNAFVILDEGQNTTTTQMKMFLTRIGFGSTIVVTGDITQIDLPKGQSSGLKHAIRILDGLPGISCVRFAQQDIVRHPLIKSIVQAYDGQGDKDAYPLQITSDGSES